MFCLFYSRWGSSPEGADDLCIHIGLNRIGCPIGSDRIGLDQMPIRLDWIGSDWMADRIGCPIRSDAQSDRISDWIRLDRIRYPIECPIGLDADWIGLDARSYWIGSDAQSHWIRSDQILDGIGSDQIRLARIACPIGSDWIRSYRIGSYQIGFDQIGSHAQLDRIGCPIRSNMIR